MTKPIISITNLQKSYKDKTVLNSMNWEIEQGDVIALLGKNGAGKTTLLESLMNLKNYDAGQIRLWDSPWKDLSQQKRESISFVSQDTVGFEWMRVEVFLSYLGSYFPKWDETYSNKLTKMWNLDPKQRVGDLSGGQTQILHVIQALSTKPELIILDEPVAHLDPNMRRQFISELIDLSYEQKSTVIFSSHIVSDLERVANKVALLDDGIIKYYYDVESLKANIAHIKISGSDCEKQPSELSGLINWKSFDGGATATVAQPLDKPIEEIAEQLGYDIEKTPLSLEDWYLEVTNESL